MLAASLPLILRATPSEGAKTHRPRKQPRRKAEQERTGPRAAGALGASALSTEGAPLRGLALLTPHPPTQAPQTAEEKPTTIT